MTMRKCSVHGTLLFLSFWEQEELKPIWSVHGDGMKSRGPWSAHKSFSSL
jgi:hypothetical protein